MSSTLTAKTAFKKHPGLLSADATHLHWKSDGKGEPLHVPLSNIKALFTSKAGSAQVRLKIQLPGDESHTFVFLAPKPQDAKDCEDFKNRLTAVIAANKPAAGTTPAPGTVPSGSSSTLASIATSGLPATASSALASAPRLSARPSPQPGSRAVSVSSDRPLGADVLNDFRIRKKVLMKDPDLAALHKDLVMSGQITETEFWEGREHLLAAQAASDAQQKGRAGQLLDMRPEMSEGKYQHKLTPQKIEQLFNDYPVVRKAFDENVPANVDAPKFWERFFKSKLHSVLQASIRSTVSQHVTQADEIFDKYLEPPDDGLEPRNQATDDVEMFVNLAASNQDHDETGNEKDVTMQAGKYRGALPLIRRFNQHSERVLKTSSAESNPTKRRRLGLSDPSDPWDYYSQIDLEDLHVSDGSKGVPLEMKDAQRYFEGGTLVSAVEQEARPAIDLRAALQAAKEDVQSWDLELAQVRIEKRSSEAAMQIMTQNVAAQNDSNRENDGIPETVMRQMRSCQAAANEFLRQFWTAIYPPLVEMQTAGPPLAPAQRQAKAARMAGFLARTPEKVSSIVREAIVTGVDRRQVEVAMQPILDTTEHALTFWKLRNTTSGR